MTPLKTHLASIAVGWILWSGGVGFAAAGQDCNIIRVSDLGEADLVINTGAAAAVLETLGYKPQSLAWSQNDTFDGLAKGSIDVFFGADTRTMAGQISSLLDQGLVEVAGVNQTFALPVAPTAATGSGELVVAGSKQEPPETIVSARGTDDTSGNGSSEETSDDPALEEQPLSGVLTLVRADFAQACPNVATFFRNLTFPADMSVSITIQMANEYDELFDAAAIWFGENRDILDLWLDGVKTTDQADAKTAVLRDFGF